MDASRALALAEPGEPFGEVEAFLDRSLQPGSRPAPETLRRRFDSDRAVIALCRNQALEVVGVNILYALSRSAVRGIEEGNVLRGAQLVDDQLIRPARGATYYLSVIAADVGHRSAVVADLWRLLAEREVTTLYSRPSTREGRRFFERTGFAPIGPPSEIWRLVLTAGHRGTAQ